MDFHGTSLPAAPRAFALLLEPALAILRDRLGQTDPGVIELESILTAVYYLPPQTETDETRIRERSSRFSNRSQKLECSIRFRRSC